MISKPSKLKKKTTKKKKTASLRKRAEGMLTKQKERLRELSSKDLNKLVHELGTHQIELEMQNEELRRAQTELEASRIKYSDLYDLAPIGYFTFDKTGMIREVNLTAADLLGIERRLLVNKPFAAFVGRDDGKAFRSHCSDVLKNRKRQTIEIRLKARDKTEFYVLLESMVVEDTEGNAIAIRTAVSDIADRRKAEAALQESELRYRSLFENMLDGYAYCRMLYDGRGRPDDFVYLAVNSAFERLTGLSNVVGKKATDVIPGIRESHPELLEIYGRVAATGRTEKFEIEFKQLGMWLSISVYSTKRDHFTAVFDNITERKNAAQVIGSSEERYRTLVNMSPDAVIVIQDGRFVFANPAALRLHGAVSLDQMVGRPVMAFIHPDDRESIHDRITKALDGETSSLAETRGMQIDGKPMLVESMGAPINYQGRPAVQVILRDITERKRIEERTVHLASFPQLNPNPVLEVDASGRISFFNPATVTLLETLGMGEADLVVFLPPDMKGILKSWDRSKEASLYREVVIKERSFIETIFLTPQFNVARIYVYDITERKRAEEALKASEAKYRLLFENMIDGFALHKIVVDEKGNPVDYVFLEANAAFERLTGLARDNIIGKRVTEALPGIENDFADWIGTYGRIALTGNDIEFEQYAESLGKWFAVSAFSPIKDHFATIFVDITERKRAEEALRNSEALYRSIGESIDYGVWVCDADGRNTYASESFLKMVGITQEQCSNFGWGKVLHPDDAERTIAAWQECVRTGGTWDIEHRFRGVDGQWHHVLARGMPVKNEQGEIISWAGINLDISRLKQTEQKLLESEEQFRTLADSIPNLAWLANGDGYITWYNRRWYEYTGTTPEQMEGWGWQSVHDPQVLPKVLERWKTSISTGALFDMEFPLRGADGIFRPFLTRVMPLLNSEGKVLRWFGTNTDITERKRAEESLRKSEERLRFHAENSPLAVIEWDTNFIVTRWSGEAERIFGWTAAETIGRPIMDLHMIYEDDVPIVEKTMAKLTDGETRKVVSANCNYTKDGRVIYCEWYNSVLLDERGRMSSVMSQVLDVTTRKQAEEAIHASEQKLRLFIEHAPAAIAMLDKEMQYLSASLRWYTDYHIGSRDIIGRSHYEVFPDLADEWKAVHRRCLAGAIEYKEADLWVREDGTTEWVRWEIRPWYSGKDEVGGIIIFSENITELKEAEIKLQSLNKELEQRVLQRTRFYLVLANINEAIVRRKDRQALFDDVCRIIVETGGFKLAWVGLVDPVSREVRPASSNGTTGYLDGIRIIAADVPEGRGPTGRAIVEARHIINTDFEMDENMKPWLERARAHGIRSSTAFPLKVGGEVIGALTIYADRPSLFTIEEITLLLAISENISFALETIEKEQERLRAVEEIRRSEAEVRDLYNNAPCGYHSLDKDGTIVRINDTELRWLGYSRDEVVGKKKVYEFYTPEGVSKFKETYHIFVERGSTAELELDLFRKDGTTFPVILNGTAIRDRKGDFVMSRSTMFDMTERKEVESRTRVTNLLLNLFTQKFNRNEYLDEVCKLLRDWSGCRHVGIRIVNPSNSIPFEACCGYDQAFLKQESGLSLATDQCICPRIIAGKPELTDLKSMTQNGSFYSNNSLQFEAGLRDNARSWYRGVCMKLGFRSLAIIPIRYREKAIGAIHLSDDRESMFTQKKVEFIEQLAFIIGEAVFRFGIEEDQMRLASAVDSAADGVVVTEPVAGTIEYVNPAFEQITGYRKEEAVGRTLHLLDSGKHDASFYQELRDVLQRDGVWQGRLYNKKRDGTIYLEDCTCSPVRDQSGKVINYVWVKRDVTDKVRLESIAEAVNMMNNIGYIFSGVRHEIGNPVNSAKMILSVLQYKLEKASKESIKENIDRSLVEIGRVESLLKSLKNFNLYENPDLQNLNLATFMQGFMNLIAEDFERKGIAVRKKIAPDAEWAYIDPRALQQVLMNLVTNAVDAVQGRDDPTISITARRETGLIHIMVEDNGKGMTDKQQQELFKPFYTSKQHGTGLGLVIVKKMLARMNCDIAITSALDKGTVVDISVPEGGNGKQT